MSEALIVQRDPVKVLAERVSGLEARMGTASRRGSYHVNEDATGSKLQNIVALARASVLSYRTEEEVGECLTTEGFPNGWIEDEETDTQAYWYLDRNNLIFVIRGTAGAQDAAIDLRRKLVPISVGGEQLIRAHTGFAESANSIWPTILEVIKKSGDNTTIWFAGHSLGGAVATLAAFLTSATFGENRIGGLYTIGQPRVFAEGAATKKFTKTLRDDRIFRVYRSIDPVPHVPWFRYKHVSGKRCYIKKNGEFVYDESSWKTNLDFLWKLARTVRKFITIPNAKNLKSLVSDHFSQGYLDDLVYSSTIVKGPGIIETIKMTWHQLSAPASVIIDFVDPNPAPRKGQDS